MVGSIPTGTTKFKNMKKVKDFFKGFVPFLIVVLGVFLTNYYLTTQFSFKSVFLGIVGFFILYPAIKKWDNTLWGDDNNVS